jgi:hypothetical protein
MYSMQLLIYFYNESFRCAGDVEEEGPTPASLSCEKSAGPSNVEKDTVTLVKPLIDMKVIDMDDFRKTFTDMKSAQQNVDPIQFG